MIAGPGKAIRPVTGGPHFPRRSVAPNSTARSALAFLVAVGAAESGRTTMMFQTKEAVRLALEDVATGVACDGCPPLRDLLSRYQQAGGQYMVCPICFNAKQLDKS